jgi:hypothetical protein
MAVLASYIGRNHFEISTRQQKKRQAIEWETKALAVLGVEEVKDKSKDGFGKSALPSFAQRSRVLTSAPLCVSSRQADPSLAARPGAAERGVHVEQAVKQPQDR